MKTYTPILGSLEALGKDPVEFALRILARANVAPGGCWEIKTNLDTKGYAMVRVFDGHRPLHSLRCHRALYEILHGKIPVGLVIDHKCRNPSCCNPEHLRAVTLAQNNTENSLSWSGKNKSKASCHLGHPLYGDNLRIRESKPTVRVCIACEKARSLKNYYKNFRPRRIAANLTALEQSQ